MRKVVKLFLLFFTFNTLLAQTVFKDYTDGMVYVKFTKASLKSISNENPRNIPLSKLSFMGDIFKKYGVSKAYKPFYKALDNEVLPYIMKFEFSDITRVTDFLSELSKMNGIEYAEKVPIMKIDVVPNDPTFPPHLTQINAANAWNVFNGSSNITVAIVDNAIMWTHQDLAANTYTNSGEIPANLIDDDGNGYVDDVNGYDVSDNDNNAVPSNTLMNHGTHCAGIAGARTDNSVGIASIGWNIKIIPVKTQNNTGSTTGIANGYEGILYAANANARIISCSWGGAGFSSAEQSVIDYAWLRGSIIIASAGNSGVTTQNYPGAYNHVYCVASVSSADVKSSFSNYGTWVDIAAPGENVYSTAPSTSTGTYITLSGTSMSTPLVAGLAAIMLSKCSFMTPTDVLNCISSTAVNIYSLSGNSTYTAGNQLGAGRIEAFQAMNCAASFSATPPVANFFSLTRNICPSTPITFYDSSLYQPTSWNWTFQNGIPATSTLSSPSVQWTLTGTYAVTLTVSNANGSNIEVKTTYITVAGPVALPLTEGFQASTFLPNGWTSNNVLNNNIYWERNASIGGFGTSTACAMFDNFNIVANGERDEMRTPKYIFSSVAAARLRFDVAYARYNASFSDTLEVRLSTNCGATWTNIYTKGGTQLSSVVGDVAPNIFVPTSAQWRRDSIDVSLLTAGQSNVMFSFVNRGHYGQPIYLDNINLAFPTPTVNFTIPSSSCIGSSFTCTNTSVGTVSYSWNLPGGSPSTSTLTSPVVSYPSAGLYTITLVAFNGTLTSSSTKTINILTTPTISINTPTLCNGSSTILTSSGAISYTWIGGATTSSISVSPTTTTVYSVTGANGSCSSIKTTTVFVNPSPTLTVNNSFICWGTNTIVVASGVTTYSWNTGALTNTLLVNPSVTTVYSVIGTSLSCSDIKTVTVSVLPNPVPSLSISVINPTLCSGGTSTIIASGSASTYSWSNGLTSASILVSPTISTIYTVVATGSFVTCTNTASTTVSINVAATPSLNVFAAPSNTICAGSTSTLYAVGPYSSITWSGSLGAVSNATVNPTTTGTYTVMALSNNGCSTSSILTLFVKSNPASVVSITNANCSNSCTGSASITTVGGSLPYTYSVVNSSCTFPCNGLCVGNYTVITNDISGCSSTNLFSINTAINNLTVLTTFTNASCATCIDGSAHVTVSGTPSPYTYTWLPSGGNQAISNGLVQGCYTVIVNDANGCAKQGTVCVGVGLNIGIEKATFDQSSLLVFPNPANTNVNIVLQGFSFDYKLYNALGQLASERENNQNSTQINLEEFTKGIYLIEILSEGNAVRKKLVVE